MTQLSTHSGSMLLSSEARDEAMVVLANMGLSLDDAIGLMLAHLASEQKFPFSAKPEKKHSDAILNGEENVNYRLGALPNITFPDNFDDIEVTDFNL